MSSDKLLVLSDAANMLELEKLDELIGKMV